jgi:protein-S-isoprenylcysteine O-methyltransferase Ste14
MNNPPKPAARKRLAAAVGSAAFLLVGPGTVPGLVPWWLSRWKASSTLISPSLTRGIGVAVIVAGLTVLLNCFVRFALGSGTPAPLTPTQHLIASGSYRYVRNPMYLAIVAVVMGQAIFFARGVLVAYALSIWLCMHLFVVFYEEPRLRRSFGAEYEAFCARVPRWLPRFHARL